MPNYKEEKRDATEFSISVIKRLSPSKKQRVADFLLGVLISEETATSSCPHRDIRAQCG